MRIKLPFIFLLAFYLLNTKEIKALTLFVSPAGSDTNPGTADKPLASLTGARNRIRMIRKTNKPEEAIQVIIRQGSYFLSEPLLLTAEDSGTDNAPIVYSAEAGSNPVFYGGLPIKGFEKVNDSLWRAFIPEVSLFGWVFEQLYVNGQRSVRAQFPNTNFYHPRLVTETVIQQGKERTAGLAVQKISLYPEQSALLQQLTHLDLEEAVITFYHKWDNTRKKITRFSVQDTAIYTVGRGMKFWNKLDSKTLFTIENVKAALDSPGEWYLERSGYLYYKPEAGETINNLRCYAPVVDQFLIIKGTSIDKVKNLHFKNLTFKVAGYKMPAMGNEPMQAAASVEATIMLDYAKNVQFINCEIAHTGSNAIWFRKACFDSKVQQCYLHDLGAGAVKIGEISINGNEAEITRNITVDNNIVRSGGYIFPCAVALALFNASDNTLTHNEIADFKYSGISSGWIWGYGPSPAKRNKIEFNHIHHLGWGVLSDMGGVYTLGESQGTTVSNNIIHHIYSNTYGGWGLYTDEGSTGIVMENNLVYACKSSAFHQHYGKDNIIRNNIFYNQMRAQLEASKIEPHVGFYFTNNIISYSQGDLSGIRWDLVNFSADSNLYWDTRTKDIKVGKQSFAEWQQSGKDRHSLIANPKFANPAMLNFRVINKAAISKIKFKPFDYSRAGVYGSQSWKDLARFDSILARKFDAIVLAHEQKLVKQ